jgi:hypothetical protein
MTDNREPGRVRRRFASRRTAAVTIVTTLFLIAVYGGGIYALTRTGTAGANSGSTGKPCTADSGHPFHHGHTTTCTSSSTSTTSSTSIGSTSIGSTSIGSTSIGSTSIGSTSIGSTSIGSTSIGSLTGG